MQDSGELKNGSLFGPPVVAHAMSMKAHAVISAVILLNLFISPPNVLPYPYPSHRLFHREKKHGRGQKKLDCVCRRWKAILFRIFEERG
jgi:hypothetical protein